jgi:hypothetical protein
MRNYRMYYLAPECLLGFITGTNKFHCWGIIDGPPEDAKVVDMFIKHDKRLIAITLEHESFDSVPELSNIPVFDVKIVSGDVALKEVVKSNWFEMFVRNALEEKI